METIKDRRPQDDDNAGDVFNVERLRSRNSSSRVASSTEIAAGRKAGYQSHHRNDIVLEEEEEGKVTAPSSKLFLRSSSFGIPQTAKKLLNEETPDNNHNARSKEDKRDEKHGVRYSTTH